MGRIEDVKDCKDNVQIKIRKLHRPEDVSKMGFEIGTDINEVYWTEDFIFVKAIKVKGKFLLMPKALLEKEKITLREWRENGPHRFYISGFYENGILKETLPEEVISVFENHSTNPNPFPKLARPLKMMDVFAGCGGLSIGMEQSGAAKTFWAIESVEPAAEAFKKNHDICTVFNYDCNDFLKEIISGKKVNKFGKTPN